jgi:hypothetical protein
MKIKLDILSIVIVSFIFLGCSGGGGGSDDPKETIPGGAGHAIVEFTSVPPLNSFDDLRGRILHVLPSAYKVAGYILVNGSYYTKPTWSSPLTSIAADGNWVMDITTGGIDETATRICAFLVPNGYNPPLAGGTTSLPQELYQNAVAVMEVVRTASEVYRVVRFANYDWRVKVSTTPVGPGPNIFSDSAETLWIDSQGFLHLKIRSEGRTWKCSEVILQKSLGYGTYTFYVKGQLDLNDKHSVLGLFTWDDDPAQNHREIDVEISKWSLEVNDNSQFVVQPWDTAGNRHRFTLQTPSAETISAHSFDWSGGSIFFQSLCDSTLVEPWNYTNVGGIPAPGNENARINLWLYNGSSPAQEVEVIVTNFTFTAR